jgi:uncharacterized protein with GYD domain
MPTYIAFGNWTDQGARAIRESPLTGSSGKLLAAF